MKIFKSAQQKNFAVNVDMYSEVELDLLLSLGIVAKPFADSRLCETSREYKCVFASYCKQVKVLYDNEYKRYYTAVILKDSIANQTGYQFIYINL